VRWYPAENNDAKARKLPELTYKRSAILQKRQSLETPLCWDVDKLIIAHGACIETNAKAFVKRAFQWLM
jgi:hypothetical protein